MVGNKFKEENKKKPPSIIELRAQIKAIMKNYEQEQFLKNFNRDTSYNPNKDLKVSFTIKEDNSEYAVNNSNIPIINNIINKNNGITRLFYRKNKKDKKLTYYATIHITNHRPISKEDKKVLQQKHPNWWSGYNWNYLIVFDII